MTSDTIAAEFPGADSGSPPARMRLGAMLPIFGGAIGQAGSAAIFGVIAILLARFQSPSEFGQQFILYGLALIGADGLDYGRSTVLVKLCANRGEICKADIRLLVTSKWRRTPFVVVAMVLADVLVSHQVHWYAFAFAAYSGTFALWQTLAIPLRAEARLSSMAICSLQERGVCLLVMLPLLGLAPTAALPVGLLAGAATVSWRLWRNLAAVPATETVFTPKELAMKARSFGSLSLFSDAQQLDALIVGAVAGPALAGTLAAASRLINPLGLLLNQISPFVFARAARRDNVMTKGQLFQLLGCIALLYAPILTILFWLSGPIVVRVLGPDYAASGSALRYLVVGVALALVSSPLTAWIQARDGEKVAAVSGVVAISLYLIAIAGAAHLHSLALIASCFALLQFANILLLVLGRRSGAWRS